VSQPKGYSEALAFFGLVACGISVRLYFRDVPNFAPVAALALFAGYFFASRTVALAVPLTIMMVSDTVLGYYHLPLMLTVYTMLALPVAARGLMRRLFRFQDGRWSSNLLSAGGLLGCGIISSVLFFLVTNFASWMVMGIYDKSWAGLLHCYAQGLPFFRYTLAGDLGFGLSLFVGYAVMRSVMVASRRQLAGDVAR